MAKKCWRVVFSGRVQGVGFRFTTKQAALALGIKGWVRNRADGKVELEIEAEEEKLTRLLEKLNDTFSGFILSYDLEEKTCQDKFESFVIRF